MSKLMSQIAHVEVTSPKIDESVRFYTDVIGLEETTRKGQSVYLRANGDHLHHTLKVTEGSEPALVHFSYRAQGEDELKEAVSRLEASGQGEGWIDGDEGHGAAYQFKLPGGHLGEIFWETELYKAPKELASKSPGRPQARTSKGCNPRYFDHVTIASPDIPVDCEFFRDNVDGRIMDYCFMTPEKKFVVFATCTVVHTSHDLGMVADMSGARGRINHLAYWLDSRDELYRAAEFLADNGHHVEFGPGRHDVGEMDFLYVREPGGIRVELNSAGYRNYLPDWKPTEWVPQHSWNDIYKNLNTFSDNGLDLPSSMMESFPAVEQSTDQASNGAKSKAPVS